VVSRKYRNVMRVTYTAVRSPLVFYLHYSANGGKDVYRLLTGAPSVRDAVSATAQSAMCRAIHSFSRAELSTAHCIQHPSATFQRAANLHGKTRPLTHRRFAYTFAFKTSDVQGGRPTVYKAEPFSLIYNAILPARMALR